jgi:tetratricopeptide (TPR) repeat protein
MRTLGKAFGFVLISSLIISGQARSATENTGSTGSVTITRHVNEASRAFAARNYAKARDEYRIAIGLSPDTLEFYYGLYAVCINSGEWDQVAFALDKIFSIDPSKRQQLGAEYGQALYQLGRYDEAIPVLKQAIKDADLPLPPIALLVPPPVVEPAAKPDVKPQALPTVAAVTPAAPPAPSYNKPTESYNVSEGSLAQFTKTFQNAAHSECIVIAEYLGYEPNGEIQYYHPPKAKYHITKILKGPPLNKDLPIRYEFHDRSNEPAPPGWKFGPDKMPEKGSLWIIFIKIALPREGMFDTYEGNYGRQPATEENLNKIYALLENSSNR